MHDDLAVIRELEAAIGETLKEVEDLDVFRGDSGYQRSEDRVVRLCLYEKPLNSHAAVARLTQLTHLGLDDNGINDVAGLAGLTRLTHLRVTYN